MRSSGLFLRLSVAVLLISIAAAHGAAIDIGARRELFVARALIEKMKGVELRLHHPQPAGALKLDQAFFMSAGAQVIEARSPWGPWSEPHQIGPGLGVSSPVREPSDGTLILGTYFEKGSLMA